MKMTNENGALSVDFLAGFTIFIIAFIWVISMIPGVMIGLQSYSIDYDAVAYRTGVILVEDPGWPDSPPWESYNDLQKSNVTRFGLAVSKNTPNILSQDKVNRFFCTTFIYPGDYHTRAIFGDSPYRFNISLTDLGGQNGSVGDILPDSFGAIRHLVKIKGVSNATITGSFVQTHRWSDKYKAGGYNTSNHVFSILIDNPRLLGNIRDPSFQIDPSRDQIMINITDLRSTIKAYPAAPPGDPGVDPDTSTITLTNVKLYKNDGGVYSNIPLPASEYPYIDGNPTRLASFPSANIRDNVSIRISPYFFDQIKAQGSQIYLALGFHVTPASTFLNNTQAWPDYDALDGRLTYVNPNTTPFMYDYNPVNVTQPVLRDAMLAIAVWAGGGVTTGGAGPSTTSHTIWATTGSCSTISPIGSVSVDDGDDQTFTIAPLTGYHITDVVVDSVSQGPLSTYTFTGVHEDHTIDVQCAINTYTITPNVIGGNGAITPGTVQTYNYGVTPPAYTITPASIYYHIVDVLVDGTSVGTVTTYTFAPITANHTINASFGLGAAPAFTSITPASGPTTGNTPVVIRGTGFMSGGSFGVTIGGAAATSVVWVDATNITAVTPAGTAGARDVVITNADGQTATGTGAFTYLTPLTAIGPITGSLEVGNTLTAGALTPAGATATYQWESATALAGPYTNITGATATTYTTVVADLTRYIRITAYGTGLYTGSVTSAAVGPVRIVPIFQVFTTAGSDTSYVPAGALNVDYLMVAGGGGGGRYGGGGGGGGYRTGTLTIGATTSYPITVGSGGAGASGSNTRGSNGGNTVFGALVATGGGGGGSNYFGYYTGAAGGSGGGGTRSGNSGGSGTAGQGYAGGAGNTVTFTSNYLGGGGGGAGAAGSAASTSTGGAGGNGITSSFGPTGSPYTYSCGGGGGVASGLTRGAAGCTGAGAGGVSTTTAPTSATIRGCGGGGSGSTSVNGGAGNVGIVILRYY